MAGETIRVGRDDLRQFCQQLFEQYGLSEHDAALSADVLVRADMRGITSHGVSRISRYTNGLASGLMRPDVSPEIIHANGSALVMSACGAMGQSSAFAAMSAAIDCASEYGMACCCLKDSNHFGIASYYAMMALEHDMIGICMTNTARLSVPTGGRRPLFGTNPIAFAAPAGNEPPFVLDMATTIVTRGDIEIFKRTDRDIPAGLAVDKEGKPASDPAELLDDMYNNRGGGLLTVGGHKGYGLAMMIDICCALLSGAPFGPQLSDLTADTKRVSHFFMAIQVDRFREMDAFKSDMDALLSSIRTERPAVGVDRVLYPGLREHEHELECIREGIPILKSSADQLRDFGSQFGIACPW